MRILKLVIWDLDETILTGILEEKEMKTNPAAVRVMSELKARGVLQRCLGQVHRAIPLFWSRSRPVQRPLVSTSKV